MCRMNPDQPEADADAMRALPSSSSRLPVEPRQRVFPSDIIPTSLLFQGHQEILISHQGEHYRLRITKNDKLILTK